MCGSGEASDEDFWRRRGHLEYAAAVDRWLCLNSYIIILISHVDTPYVCEYSMRVAVVICKWGPQKGGNGLVEAGRRITSPSLVISLPQERPMVTTVLISA